MATEHLTAPTSLCDLFHEPELCKDEILTILQTLDDNYNNIFNVAVSGSATPCGSLKDDKNSTTTNNNSQNKRRSKRRRKKPVQTTSSSSPGFGSDEEFSDYDHAVLSQRKSATRLKDSRPVTSIEDVSSEDGVGNGKVVSHIAVERNRRKQMNEHLAVLKQLMPCFYVKKGDQASIIGGVIDYITELQQVLQSLEAKKQRKIYTSEVGKSPRVAPSSRLLIPQQLSNPSPISPRKQPLSPRSLITFPISPSTPQSTSPFKPLIKQPNLIQPSSLSSSPTSNSSSSPGSSFAEMIMMMNNSHNNNNYSGVANELVISSRSNVADVALKFCGPNLELKTLSSKIAGQTLKMVSAIEDLSLEILQVSINTVEQTMLNAFTIKIGIDCQLSAEELAQQIQQTFC